MSRSAPPITSLARLVAGEAAPSARVRVPSARDSRFCSRPLRARFSFPTIVPLPSSGRERALHSAVTLGYETNVVTVIFVPDVSLHTFVAYPQPGPPRPMSKRLKLVFGFRLPTVCTVNQISCSPFSKP